MKFVRCDLNITVFLCWSSPTLHSNCDIYCNYLFISCFQSLSLPLMWNCESYARTFLCLLCLKFVCDSYFVVKMSTTSREVPTTRTIDLRNRCINCFYAIIRNQRRYSLEQATTQMINVLQSWITPTQVSTFYWRFHTYLSISWFLR